MGLIGHNRGPSMDGGTAWRTHCWGAARASLLPNLPIEVVRMRVKRARELGLEYKTYAGIRAQTGHDVVAFLFSSNALALRVTRPIMPADLADKLTGMECTKIGLATAPLSASAMAQNSAIDAAHPAPYVLSLPREITARLRAALGGIPSDRVVLVGDAPLEAEWCAHARLAAYLPRARFFGAAPQ